ncbi:MAG: MOSC domain-containing protein [Rhodobacteraceae bacterium]|nr:MOSC domain-containing protein [Paracoccaceae bacterium]
MSGLKEMMARWAQPGRVDWIGVRPERHAQMREVTAVDVNDSGLIGDRGRAGQRAVTMIQAEHLPSIGSMMGQAAPDPCLLRRNLVISGINLAALKRRRVWIGSALVELTVVCAPCSQMEAALGHGGHSAMRGQGGWCARVVTPGRIALGDAVTPSEFTGQ